MTDVLTVGETMAWRPCARSAGEILRNVERVLMLAGDAAEDLETFFILFRLREEGYAVDVAAPSPEYIRADPDVRRIVTHFFERDLPVGLICHGPQVPAAYGLLEGRKVSAFPPLAPDIEAAGGEFVDGPDVVDRNLVSCRGWGDLAEWSRAFVAALERAAVPA